MAQWNDFLQLLASLERKESIRKLKIPDNLQKIAVTEYIISNGLILNSEVNWTELFRMQ